MSLGEKAYEELMHLLGEQIMRSDALIGLLIKKGVISDKEWGDALEYELLDRRPDISAAEWARRHMNEPALLEKFFKGQADS